MNKATFIIAINPHNKQKLYWNGTCWGSKEEAIHYYLQKQLQSGLRHARQDHSIGWLTFH